MDKQIRWSELGYPAPGEGIQTSSADVDPERIYLNSEVLSNVKRRGCRDAWLIFRTTEIFAGTLTYLHLIDYIPIP
ncbi:MAG: hypothetical protein KF812_04160 [Fimbriimonadaceae bacterium]|nr:hypothetical protein [Fimbriimonadaceae bacterium]